MKKLYLLLLLLPSPFYRIWAQCPVSITTAPSTTQINCRDTVITLTANHSTPPPANVVVTYLWENNDTAHARQIRNAGLYKVTMTATDTSVTPQTTCTSVDSIHIIQDTVRPLIYAVAFPDIICRGSSSTLQVFSPASLSWNPDSLTGNLVTVRPDTTATFTVTGTTATNGCKDSASVTVVVRPLPTATISGDTTVCQNATLPRVTFTGAGATKPYTFAFTISGSPTTQLITTAATNDTVLVAVPTGLLGGFRYDLISVSDANGCGQSQSGAVTVTVLPGPVLNSLRTQSVCDSALFTDTIRSSIQGTAFTWTRDPVAGISNGGQANVQDSIINEWLDNTTSRPVVVKYTVTMSTGSGCVITDSIMVTVNPTPVINKINDTTFCNGFFVANGIPFGSASPNASFTWTNTDSTIGMGLSASGVGSFPPFIVSNGTNANKTDTVSVAISANNCTGASTKFVITAVPGPVLISRKADSVCTGVPFTYTATSSFDPGTTFRWIRVAVPGNPARSGTTNIIRDTLRNTTSQPITVDYVFTLSAGGTCQSTETVKVTVNPTPVINKINDTTFCNGFFVANGIPFSSASPNASFTWANTDSTIGKSLPASGAGSFPPFVASNSTNANKTDTVSVAVSASKCAGAPTKFVITVKPSPPQPGFISSSGHPDKDSLRLCEESENINFNVTSPDTAAVRYNWTVTPAGSTGVSIRDTAHANTVISFTDQGTYAIAVTAIYKRDTTNKCTATASQTVIVNANSNGIQKEKIFLMQPGGLLVYPDNSLKGYQWGYDAVIVSGSTFGPPVSVSGQVRHFFIPDKPIDTTKFLYWVELKNGDTCSTRVYYNGPYANRLAPSDPVSSAADLQLFPNPNRGSFEMRLKGNIYGRMEAKIYDALGHVVGRKSFVKTVPEVSEAFGAAGLPAGLYYVEVLGSDLKKVVSRFVIQY